MSMEKIIILLSLVCFVALSLGGIHAANETIALQSTGSDNLSSPIAVDGSSTDDITNAIAKAEEGGTVDLGENKEYDINNDSISISKKITLKGNNVTITSGSSEGGLWLQGSGITIQGIIFKNGVEVQDDDGIVGKAIYAMDTFNLLIKDCRFINYECGIDIHDSNYTSIKNCSFNATATSLSAMAETGAKAIQLTDSTDASIINNTFFSQVQGGLIIASESVSVCVENNSFTNTSWFSSNPNQTFILEEIPSQLTVLCENQTDLSTTGQISNEVKELAIMIVGETKGIEAVKKLANWVSSNIAHETAAGFYQSPLVTLQRKMGNCCCHSELFLQMCDYLGYTKQFDMYIVHVGTMEFKKRHFFTVIGTFCVDTSKKNPWGKGGFGKRPVYSITKYPYLPLIRQYD